MNCLRFNIELGCSRSECVIYWALLFENMECLQYGHLQRCPWPKNAGLLAAQNKTMDCLRYIYECCGNDVTWEDSGLDDFEDEESIPESVKAYLRNVAESWKNGDNRTVNIKPAKH